MFKRFTAETRWSVYACLFVLGLITAIVVLPFKFSTEAAGKKGLFTRTESQDPGLPNYDIRTAKGDKIAEFFEAARNNAGKSAVSVADIREGFVRGEEALRSRQPQVKFEYNDDIRIPEVITPDVWKAKIEFLSSPSSDKRSDILRNFVKQNNDLIGVSDQQADGLVVAADYTNPDGNMSFAHLEQQINGVPVFRGEVKAGFTKDGRIIRVINNIAPGLDYGSLSTEFGDPASAVRAAAGYINHEIKPADTARNDAASTDLKVVFGQGDWATTAEKMYFPTEPGVAVPSWRVLIWEPVNAYYVIVDANTGTMLWRKNISADQTQSATYQVYRNAPAYVDVADNPAPLSPGPLSPALGTQGAIATRANVTLIGNEGTLSFNNNGWITDAANLTDGNALEAGVDRDGVNGVDAATIAVGSPTRVFSSTWNPAPGSPAPGDDPLSAQAQRGAVIQMFYAMNRYHDELYKRGFTEPARNFQALNFGRGGSEADRVSAEGQDSSGTNNANFATPADGGRGRMQMYLWTGPTPDYDGTADSEVIYHEATHGTSNRLHGNGSGLSTNMAGGMGEGWSDWYAETMLSEPTDPINAVYTTGGYATYLLAAGFTGNYYYGIRRFPRAPITFTGGPNNLPHNPFTFKHINVGCDTTLGTTTTAVSSAFPRSPVIATSGSCDQVHNAGEVWSSMLWEVRNRFVTRLGHTAGTTRVLQAVTDGMKLAPLAPTFLSERDAIIAAAAALPIAPEATADVTDIREGFRVRGAGFSASIQAISPAAVTEAFDTPNVSVGSPFAVNDSTGNNNGVPEPGENVLLSIPVTNPNTGAAITNVQVNVNGGANVSYGTIADGATVTNSIPYTISAAAPCGSTVSVTINITSSAGAQIPAVRSFALGTPSGTVQNFDGVTAPNLPAGWTATQDTGTGITWATTATGPNSAPNSAFAADPATVNMSSIESPVIPITSAAAQLKFKNKYITESTFDGMVLEIKIGAGAYADFITAGGSWVSGGYNATISTSFTSPIAGRQAWSGTSAGGYIDTVANLPAAANGQSIQLRWRMASDSSVASTGVNIDDVQVVSSFTCQPVAPVSKKPFDFDGDGKTDISVLRPNAGSPQWWVLKSTGGNFATQFGAAGDITTPADYTGDGKADIAFFRPNTGFWYVLRSEDLTFYAFGFGTNNDVPAPGDYDGDNKVDAAVFRPSNSTWYISKSSGGTTITTFGAAGDLPINADYDGDGKSDIAIYRPNAGNPQWWIQRSTAGLAAYQFGAAGDKTVVGDYTGDGKADVAFFRPSTNFWYVLRSEDLSFFAFPFGAAGDVPVPGDYDGDGKFDGGVFRPSSNTWYINRTGGSGVLIQPFGAAGDIALPNTYVR